MRFRRRQIVAVTAVVAVTAMGVAAVAYGPRGFVMAVFGVVVVAAVEAVWLTSRPAPDGWGERDAPPVRPTADRAPPERHKHRAGGPPGPAGDPAGNAAHAASAPAPVPARTAAPAPGAVAPWVPAPVVPTAVAALAPAPDAVPAGATGAGWTRAEEGRFPLLQHPSSASSSPWRLPALPAPSGIAADEAVLGGLEIRAASVVGPSHRGRAAPRQDAYRLGQDSAGRYLVVAVADGMSDSGHSEVGAQVAVIALVGALRDALDAGVRLEDIDARQIFLAAAQQMNAAAEQRNWSADDVRAVAVAAVVPAHPHTDGHRRVWLGAVADATAWALRDSEWDHLIGDRKSASDAGYVTHFLPYNPERADAGTFDLGPGEVLAVMTDGVGDALSAGRTAQRWFAQRWQQPPNVGAFLLDVGFEQRQMQDDRTAVVVWCADGRPRR